MIFMLNAIKNKISSLEIDLLFLKIIHKNNQNFRICRNVVKISFSISNLLPFS